MMTSPQRRGGRGILSAVRSSEFFPTVKSERYQKFPHALPARRHRGFSPALSFYLPGFLYSYVAAPIENARALWI